MGRERIRRIHQRARDERFISGIYNYCDRWCERCPLGHRCMIAALARLRREVEAKFPNARAFVRP